MAGFQLSTEGLSGISSKKFPVSAAAQRWPLLPIEQTLVQDAEGPPARDCDTGAVLHPHRVAVVESGKVITADGEG
jgi:hypothetical protein